MWPTAAEEASLSGSSGIFITVESEKGSTSALDSAAKTSSKLSPELVKRLRDASGKYQYSFLREDSFFAHGTFPNTVQRPCTFSNTVKVMSPVLKRE